jgi:hypothetical protein
MGWIKNMLLSFQKVAQVSLLISRMSSLDEVLVSWEARFSWCWLMGGRWFRSNVVYTVSPALLRKSPIFLRL